MYETVTSVRARISALLQRANLPHNVFSIRKTGSPSAYVLIAPQDSPITRDSVNNTDQDILELKCYSGDADIAMKMMDAIVDDLRDLSADGMVVRGARFVGCECVGQRTVVDATEAEEPDTFLGSTTWQFTIEKKRPPKPQ